MGETEQYQVEPDESGTQYRTVGSTAYPTFSVESGKLSSTRAITAIAASMTFLDISLPLHLNRTISDLSDQGEKGAYAPFALLVRIVARQPAARNVQNDGRAELVQLCVDLCTLVAFLRQCQVVYAIAVFRLVWYECHDSLLMSELSGTGAQDPVPRSIDLVQDQAYTKIPLFHPLIGHTPYIRYPPI